MPRTSRASKSNQAKQPAKSPNSSASGSEAEDDVNKLLESSGAQSGNGKSSKGDGTTKRTKTKFLTTSASRSRSEKVMIRGFVGKYALVEVLSNDGKYPGFVGMTLKLIKEWEHLIKKSRIVFLANARLDGKPVYQKNSNYPQTRIIVDTDGDRLAVAGKKLAKILTAVSEKTKYPKKFSFGGVTSEGNLTIPWVDLMDFDDATNLVMRIFGHIDRQVLATKHTTLLKMVYGSSKDDMEHGSNAILEHGDNCSSESDVDSIDLGDIDVDNANSAIASPGTKTNKNKYHRTIHDTDDEDQGDGETELET